MIRPKLLLALAALSAFAQSPAPNFEVVSIHEVVNGVRVIGDVNLSGNRAEYLGFSIQMLISEAWKVRGDQVALAPGVDSKTVYPLMEAERSARIYEIAALAPEGMTPTRDDLRPMEKSLLITRFKLATHTEKRDKDVYVLSVNGTPKLKRSPGEGTCRAMARRTPEGQTMAATHCPVQTLIGNLFIDRPVYDETGLTGFYDFESTSVLPFQANDPLAITPFSAVKELGLKLYSNTMTRSQFLMTGAACAVPALAAEPTAAEKTNLALVADFCAAFAARDMTKIASYLAPNCSYRITETSAPAIGPAAIERINAYVEQSSKIEFKILESWARGPMVINERIDSFTRPNASPAYHLVGVFFIKDGKIAEWTDYGIRG